MLHTLRGVIFDMDGLMLDTERMYRLAWQGASAELGFTITDELYATFTGRPLVDCEAELVRTFGADYPQARFKLRRRELWQQHLDEIGIPHKPGLPELLDWLDGTRLRKGVATSTTGPGARLCLGPLAQRFDAIVTGDEVLNGKPAPDIFLLAADRLELAPEQCLVLEDSEAGARAGLAAGMTVIVVPDLVHPPEDLAAQVHRVCSSLHEVRQLFHVP